MSKLFAAAAPLLVAVSLQAAAVTTEDEATYLVRGTDRPDTPMAAWNADGQVATASGAAAVADAPQGAVRYAAKLVAWPTATVKVLTFSKDAGGVLHPITDEKTVYVLEGGLQATVDGATVDLSAGDLVSLPEDALRNAGAARPGRRGRRLDCRQPDTGCHTGCGQSRRREHPGGGPAHHPAL